MVLIFSNNCELLSSVTVQDWQSFTDHKLVIANANYQFNEKIADRQEQYLCETGKRYGALDFYKAP